ncbi:hypothetical protein JCM10213_001691 [Rhodosporidiobolus nylandii]
MPSVVRSLPFTPRRTGHLLHLLLSLSTLSFSLSILSYLLSPSHVLLLIYRAGVQLQLTNPRRTNPERSLRTFVLVAWAPCTVAGLVWHALGGSRGTKGEKGWAQGGLVLDFIGQAVTPSTPRLLVLDVVLALCQLATLIVAFGATIASDLDASTATVGVGEAGESARDYGLLLGELDEGFEDDEDEDDGEGEGRGGTSRRKSGYAELVETGVAEDEADSDLFQRGVFSYRFKPSSLSSALPTDQHVRLPPVADIRLRTLVREIVQSAQDAASAREDGGMRGVEEGRGGEV